MHFFKQGNALVIAPPVSGSSPLSYSICGKDGVEAANVIWHAVECMAAVARHPEDTGPCLKWAAESAVISDDHLDSDEMTEQAWEDYDRLLGEKRL